MGEIADMMLEGLLDEETGEYIGDINKGRYGTESPGFPVSYERERREQKQRLMASKKLACPECGKKVKGEQGVLDHMRDVHTMTLSPHRPRNLHGE